MHVLLCNERNITVCCKFPRVHPHQILLKLVNIRLSYSENKKGELFLKQNIYLGVQLSTYTELTDVYRVGQILQGSVITQTVLGGLTKNPPVANFL